MVRVLLLCIILLIYLYMMGSVACFFYEKLWNKKNQVSVFLPGLVCCFGMFELLALFGIWRGLSVQTIAAGGAALAGAGLLLAGVLLLFKDYRRYLRRQAGAWIAGSGREKLWYVFFFLLLVCVYFLQAFVNETRFDTPETVMTILQTDTIHTVNPLTGLGYDTALRWQDKLANLPLFYALLVRWSGVKATTLLFRVMPLFTVFAAFLTMRMAALLFFSGRQRAQRVFLFAFVLVTLCGNHAYMNTSYGILHAPYEGSTLFESILLPLAFCFLMAHSHWPLRGQRQKSVGGNRLLRAGFLLVGWVLLFLNAAFLNGLYKGCLILACEVTGYVLAQLLYRGMIRWRLHRQVSPGKEE